MSEIIIDGINVADCEYYIDVEDNECSIKGMGCNDNNTFCFSCRDNHNCMFKRLKRLEAEKQEKVLKMAEAEVEIEKLQAENERLEAENEQLKLDYKDKINLLEQVVLLLYPNANENELYDIAFNCEFIDKLKNLLAGNKRLKENLSEAEAIIITYRTVKEEYKQALEKIRTELLQNSCANSEAIRSVIAIIDEVLN